MRVIIAGSRTFDSRQADVLATIKELALTLSQPVTEVISGGAAGVDSLGEFWARWSHESPIPVRRFPADWEKFGRAAGAIRNKQMAENADALLLIWDGESRGSADMKRQATELGLEIVERVLVLPVEK